MTPKPRLSRRALLNQAITLGATRVLPGLSAYGALAPEAKAWSSWSGFTVFSVRVAAKPPRRNGNVAVYDMGSKRLTLAYRLRQSDDRKVRDFQIYTFDETRNTPIREILKMRINTRDGGNLNTVGSILVTALDARGGSVETIDPFKNALNQVIPPNGSRRLSRYPSDANRSPISRWHRLSPSNPLLVRGSGYTVPSQSWRLAFDFDPTVHGLPQMAPGDNAIHIRLSYENDRSDFRSVTGDVSAFTIVDANGASVLAAPANVPGYERLTSHIARTVFTDHTIYTLVLDEALTQQEFNALRAFQPDDTRNLAGELRFATSSYQALEAVDFDVTPGTWMSVNNDAPWRVTGPHVSREITLRNANGAVMYGVLVLTT